ncbi:MAG: CBS domain-containing protein [Gammaproteobacteria bacterium]|nr:CBS domain-containing protein [Gammaproteobacteria bacterium]
MKTLNFHPTSEIDELAWPEEEKNLSLESSALSFFTDFLQIKPLVIESTVSAVEAKKLMQKAHVRMKVIINEKNQFIGVISAEDIIERKIVQKVSEGTKRDEVALTELMTSKRDLRALDYNEVSKSTIADVIAVLKNSGEQHCLVIDRETHKIRGIFSASDISRKLHLPIDIQDKSSFYKVFSATT